MPYSPTTVRLQWQETALRGNIVTPFAPRWPAKDPSEVVTLQADWTLLAALPTDTISALHVAPTDATLTVISSGKAGLLATVMFSGGAAGQTQPVVLTVRLSSGAILTRAILLPIIAQPGATPLPIYPLPTAQQVLVTDPATGLALIDPATGQFVISN